MKTVNATKARMLLTAIAFSYLIVSCKKQDTEEPVKITNNVTDTTKMHTKPPKTYLEIWVVDHSLSNYTGYLPYDSLKVVTKQLYIANSDSCMMLWGDTAKTTNSLKYVPELLVNLGNATTQYLTDGSSRYSVRILSSPITNSQYELSYDGQQDHSSKMNLLIPYYAQYSANTSIVFVKVK